MSITVHIDVDDVIDELTDQDLLDEIRARNITVPMADPDKLDQLLTEIHYLRESGKDYQDKLCEYIWQRIGKMAC